MYRSLQLCRALAALCVVLYHCSGNLAKPGYFGAAAKPFEEWFWFGGDAGVAFFFVLSGFIIHHVHAKDLGHAEQLAPYVAKRLIRIYPTYLLVFMGVYAAAWLAPAMRDKLPTDLHVLLKALLLLPQDPQVVGGTGAPVLVVAWSLQYELLFYLLFAAGIVSTRALMLASAVLAVCVAAGAMFGPLQFPLSYFSNYLIALFFMGMAASNAHQRQVLKRGARPLSAFAALLLLALAAWATAWREGYTKPVFDLAYGLFSALLVLALVQLEEQAHRPWRIGPWAGLGDASYALYLMHFPLVALLCKASVLLLPRTTTGAGVALVMTVACCVLAAVMFHRAVEKPILQWLGRQLESRPGRMALR